MSSGMGFGGMDAVMMQERIAELEKEWARSLEATDIAVNGARSATFELRRVREELERVKGLGMDEVDRRLAAEAAHEKTKASYERCFDAHDRLTHLYAAERARAEKLREALQGLVLSARDPLFLWLRERSDEACEALAATEVKP